MNYMLPNWQGSIKLYQHLKKGFSPQQNIYFRRTMEPIPERLAICIFLRHIQRKMVLIALSDFAAASTFVGRVPSYDIPAKSYNPSISIYSRSRFYRDMTPKISRYIAAALHTHIDTHTHTHPHPHTHTHTHTRTHTLYMHVCSYTIEFLCRT